MRTTLALDDDVLRRAKELARVRRVSLGKVASELMRRGLALEIGERDGFPIFAVAGAARAITSKAVRNAEDEW